jgi:hypothetical protein
LGGTNDQRARRVANDALVALAGDVFDGGLAVDPRE